MTVAERNSQAAPTKECTDSASKVPERIINNPLAVFVFENVTWDYYTQTLEALDRSGQHARVTYDRGKMEIMTVGRKYEIIKKAIGRLLETYAGEMRIGIEGVGNVTCRRAGLDRGLEPDECYYVTTIYNGTNDTLDLDHNPPPDLAVEVEVSNELGVRSSIYADLGVPELWRFNGLTVIVMERVGNEYRPVEKSRFFPAIDMEEFSRFVIRAIKDQRTAVLEYSDLLRTRKGR
jgi:Uma2 family endonuclease